MYNTIFRCDSIRLMRFLYSLGFEKKSIKEGENEYWEFEKSNELQEALNFFFYMRKKQKHYFKGVNDNA